jgi:hypothetical protein
MSPFRLIVLAQCLWLLTIWAILVSSVPLPVFLDLLPLIHFLYSWCNFDLCPHHHLRKDCLIANSLFISHVFYVVHLPGLVLPLAFFFFLLTCLHSYYWALLVYWFYLVPSYLVQHPAHTLSQCHPAGGYILCLFCPGPLSGAASCTLSFTASSCQWLHPASILSMDHSVFPCSPSNGTLGSTTTMSSGGSGVMTCRTQ